MPVTHTILQYCSVHVSQYLEVIKKEKTNRSKIKSLHLPVLIIIIIWKGCQRDKQIRLSSTLTVAFGSNRVWLLSVKLSRHSIYSESLKMIRKLYFHWVRHFHELHVSQKLSWIYLSMNCISWESDIFMDIHVLNPWKLMCPWNHFSAHFMGQFIFSCVYHKVFHNPPRSNHGSRGYMSAYPPLRCGISDLYHVTAAL